MPEALAIAVDGPVASGKTAVGSRVATRVGARFLDTGLMYRAATWTAINTEIDLRDEEALVDLAKGLRFRLITDGDGDRLLVDGRDVTDGLRDPEVERGVSLLSRISGVRSELVVQQRAIAEEGPIVMVGRDIGTVVMPDAPVKVFLNASVEVRAKRRYIDLQSAGMEAGYPQVLEALQRRDSIDSQRLDSPLRPAEDATLIDSDDLEIEEVIEKILSLVRRD